MSRIIKIFLFILPAFFLFASSCKKEHSCEGCKEANMPPVAIAGPDQVIVLPADSVLLDGSASHDPDGTISSFLWTRINGSSATINTAAAAQTIVKNLATGVYRFELKVTDDKGLSARDTVQVSVTDPGQPNQPPVANAGADQVITLPANSVNLDGSASTDPDNNIVSYTWEKISGPPSFSITNSGAVQTQAGSLTEGIYLFELTVTDAGGLFSKDTMQVQVDVAPPSPSCGTDRPQVSAQLVPVGNLSLARHNMSATAVGSKIFFAGGVTNAGVREPASTRVDIYDISANTWTIEELSVGRHYIAATSAGDLAFFAAGDVFGELDVPINIVDIFNTTTNTWKVDTLPTIQGYGVVAAAAGTKVLFAGFNVVDPDVNLYDITNGNWSTYKLPEWRIVGASAVTAGNKIYISGGWRGTGASQKVYMYDYQTDSWATDSLIEPKMHHAGLSVENTLFWAGGLNGNLESCLVEIRDLQTNSSSNDYLERPVSWQNYHELKNAVVSNNRIIFLRTVGNGRDQFDIYDIATNIWSIGILPQPIPGYATVISVNNTIYIAGGSIGSASSNQVWRLEF